MIAKEIRYVPGETAALLMVDIQPDFMPGGALAVAGGDEIVEIVVRLAPHFAHLVATQDWHPDGHRSFGSSHGLPPFTHLDQQLAESSGADDELVEYLRLVGGQMMWPDHCVQGTPGAALHAAVVALEPLVFQKGADPIVDSYSGLRDNAKRDTGLTDVLRGLGITELTVVGLALDYCVGFTCLDAAAAGFRVHLVLPATRAVGDATDMLNRLEQAGVVFLDADLSECDRLGARA
jgi:nicotinamidase/pyrazinamidase